MSSLVVNLLSLKKASKPQSVKISFSLSLIIHALALFFLLKHLTLTTPPNPAPALVISLLSLNETPQSSPHPTHAQAMAPAIHSVKSAPLIPSSIATLIPEKLESASAAKSTIEEIRSDPIPAIDSHTPHLSAQTPVGASSASDSTISEFNSAQNLIAPRFDAHYLNNPPPPYPPFARRRNVVGTVVLRVLVNELGNPEQVSVEQTSGSNELDHAALTTVKQRWHFVPAQKGNITIAATVLVPIQFKLND